MLSLTMVSTLFATFNFIIIDRRGGGGGRRPRNPHQNDVNSHLVRKEELDISKKTSFGI